MKRFASIILLSFALLSFSELHAQFSPLTLGVKGGVNFTSMSEGYKNRMKYHVGATLDYEFTDNFYLMTGVVLKAKGGKKKEVNITEYLPNPYTDEENQIIGNMTVNPLFLHIPLHLACKIDLMMGTRLVFHTGPYIAFGVGGKTKINYRDESGVKHSMEEDYFGSNRASRTDFGLGLGVGLELGKLAFDVNYDYGLTNQKQWLTENKTKNRNLEFSVGYKFQL